MVVEPADCGRLFGVVGAAVLLFRADEAQQFEGEVVLDLPPVTAVGEAHVLPQQGTGEPDQQLAQVLEAQAARQHGLALVRNCESTTRGWLPRAR